MSNPFPSILVPLDGSHLAAQALGCATWLASRLGASVHVLSATAQERPAREELMRLKVPEEYWPLVTLHQASAYPEQAILAGITRYDARLVVITARGEAAEAPTVESPDPERSSVMPHAPSSSGTRCRCCCYRRPIASGCRGSACSSPSAANRQPRERWRSPCAWPTCSISTCTSPMCPTRTPGTRAWPPVPGMGTHSITSIRASLTS